MKDDEIKIALKQYNFSESEISKVIEYFNYATLNNIPYPLYYALTRMSV